MAPEKLPRPPKLVLDSFYGLSSYDDAARDSAASKLLTQLQESKETIPYCLDRLIKGLASPREAARLGFSIALTELLRSSAKVSCEEVFALMDKHLPLQGAGENGKNNAIAQTLCVLALIRSKKCIQALDKTMEKLMVLRTDRPYLELPWAQALVSVSLLVDEELFSSTMWPLMKRDCNVGLDTCTASLLWMLLEMDAMHQKYIRRKAKLFRSGTWPPTNEEQFHRVGEIVADGVRSTPSGTHPLERSLLLAMMVGDCFEDFWKHAVCGCLINSDDKIVSLSGIRLIGHVLSMQPSKKQLKTVLSEDSLKLLLKFMLDRRPAARFVRSVAWNQISAIHRFVDSNKENPALQFLALKKILDVSLNFDSISGSNMVDRIIGSLSSEAAGMVADELISKLKSQRSDAPQLMASDVIVIIKLLSRLFESSKYSFKESSNYRSKILVLFATDTFMKPEFTDLPPSVLTETKSETIKNAFMRCLGSLCMVFTSPRTKKTKFEFPQESAVVMAELIDMLIDHKHSRLLEKCNIVLKPAQEQVAVRAAKAFHQMRKSMRMEKSKELSSSESEMTSFAILIGYVLFWFLTDPDDYAQALADLLVCWEKCQKKEPSELGLSWEDVLIDVMMNLLSRPHRYIRIPLQVAFHYFCPCLNSDHLRPLLQALRPSDKENLVADGESDMDEDGEEIEENGTEESNDLDQPHSSEESELDDESIAGDDASGQVDPELKRAVQDALGDAAMNSDTASIASDLPDEAMLKLDESLAAVFRSHLSRASAKKSARDLAEQAQAFRVRCFDLLLVLIHSRPSTELLAGILIPLLNVANEAVKISDQKTVFNRSCQVIERVTRMRDLPPPPVDSSAEFMTELCHYVKDLVEFTRAGCTNPSVLNLASDCLRFLLKLSDSVVDEGAVEQFESEVKSTFSTKLDSYLKDRSCLLPTSIFLAAFQKRPILFVENLPALGNGAFDPTVRPFRRHEACELIRQLIVNKDTVISIRDKDKTFNSTWKRFIDRLHSATLEYIEQMTSDCGDGKCEKADTSTNSPAFKATDAFEVFTVLNTVANLQDVLPLRHLRDGEFIDALEKLNSSSKMGQKTGKAGQGRRWVRFSKLCSGLVKKLRVNEAERKEETLAVEKNDDDSAAAPPKKMRKSNG